VFPAMALYMGHVQAFQSTICSFPLPVTWSHPDLW
jgi:hypothetical protein